MSSFQAVNTALPVPEPPQARPGDETTPTTPRPTSRFFAESKAAEEIRADESSAKTPTRNTFAAGLAGQRPLPTSPFTPGREVSETPSASNKSERSREGSHKPTQSTASAQDVHMGDGDEEKEASDNESVTSDSNRPSKKKKGQRFFCTDFPPCNLSFTRSEHLARHIRYVFFFLSLYCLLCDFPNSPTVSIPENGPFSVTAQDASRASTISGSMHKPSTSTKTFPQNHWRPQARDFSDKYEPIAYARQGTARGQTRWAAQADTAAATAGICQLLASRPPCQV